MNGEQEGDVMLRGADAAKCSHGFTLQRVVQQHFRGCGLACVAMATGGVVTYDEVAHRARERGWLGEIISVGCTNRRLRLLLRDFGIESEPPVALTNWSRIDASLAIVVTAWPKCPALHYMVYERIRVDDRCADRLLDPLQRMPTGVRWDVTKVLPVTVIRLL